MYLCGQPVGQGLQVGLLCGLRMPCLVGDHIQQGKIGIGVVPAPGVLLQAVEQAGGQQDVAFHQRGTAVTAGDLQWLFRRQDVEGLEQAVGIQLLQLGGQGRSTGEQGRDALQAGIGLCAVGVGYSARGGGHHRAGQCQQGDQGKRQTVHV